MKKIYLFLVAAFFAVSANAQKVLVGGNMENSDDWTVSFLNGEVDPTYKFNYEDDGPDGGESGCLHIVGSNELPKAYTQAVFYQEITLTAGEQYELTGVFKAVNELKSFWLEIVVSNTEPAVGEDWGSNGTIYGGFKDDNTDCTSNPFDGAILENGCLGETNIVTVEGEGEVTMYFGIKLGIWNNEENIAYDIMIDEMSLVKLENTNAINYSQINAASIFPNPANDILNINLGDKNIQSIEILNTLGKQVIKPSLQHDAINISNLSKGIYFVKVMDTHNNLYTSKLIKK